jgi:hypothetical protein
MLSCVRFGGLTSLVPSSTHMRLNLVLTKARPNHVPERNHASARKVAALEMAEIA